MSNELDDEATKPPPGFNELDDEATQLPSMLIDELTAKPSSDVGKPRGKKNRIPIIGAVLGVAILGAGIAIGSNNHDDMYQAQDSVFLREVPRSTAANNGNVLEEKRLPQAAPTSTSRKVVKPKDNAKDYYSIIIEATECEGLEYVYAATNDTDFVSVCETEPKGYVYRSLLAGNQLELPAKKEGYSKFVAKDGQRVITIDKNVVLIEEVDASILTGYAYYFESEADTTSLVEEISMLIWRSADEH